ncbi:MAG: hypothetical protein KGO92_07890 [Bacteroidota bacterium]|nr:hypothetical protein [Bacteroidota bacterium]
MDEIAMLRCVAWENSPFPNSINFTKYPNGFTDILDKDSLHFFSVNQQDEIIAAARLTRLEDLTQLPYPKIFTSYPLWPVERPFLFYSRLVIHPAYRKKGLKEKLDSIRIRYQSDHSIPFSVATATAGRVEELRRYGFRKIATVSKEIDPLFPFEHGELLLLKEIKL